MKIYYHNDLDGRAAGAVVWQTIPKHHWMLKRSDCELIEFDYKDKINIDNIKKDEQIIIVDFSFKPEVMEIILLKTQNIIWIDHHKTAFEYKYSKELDGLRDNNFSGCELAWKYFFPDTEIPESLKLIGDRDRWKWQYGKETAEFNQGMMTIPHQPQDEIWNSLLRIGEVNLVLVENIKRDGKVCLKFRDNFCANYAKSYGFEAEFEEHKCFALGIYMFGSEAFGDKINKYDICISFVYLGDIWQVGLYSNIIDVSEIAVKYGGGGHSGAAGFTCQELPFKKK